MPICFYAISSAAIQIMKLTVSISVVATIQTSTLMSLMIVLWIFSVYFSPIIVCVSINASLQHGTEAKLQ